MFVAVVTNTETVCFGSSVDIIISLYCLEHCTSLYVGDIDMGKAVIGAVGIEKGKHVFELTAFLFI